MSYIELKDSGLYVDQWQVKRMEYELRTLLEECQPVVIPMFVHGLQGNSQPNNRTLQEFHSMLSNIEIDGWHVFAVFVGWRGKSWVWGPLSLTTFGARRAAAKSVGLGQFQELLVRLEALVSLRKECGCSQPAKVIIFGHSLGGYIVYEALWRGIVNHAVSDSARTPEKKIEPRRIADRIVLLNPAISAIDYELFYRSAANLAFNTGIKPAFEIFASDKDSVIHGAFATHSSLESITKDPSESRKLLISPVTGKAIDYVTHTLNSLSCNEVDLKPASPFRPAVPAHVVRVLGVNEFKGHGDIWPFAADCVKRVVLEPLVRGAASEPESPKAPARPPQCVDHPDS